MPLVHSPPAMNLHALATQADYSIQQEMTRFIEAEASHHNDFESLIDIETVVDFNHLMRHQSHAFSIQFMYRYAAARDTSLPDDAGDGFEEPAMDITLENVDEPQEDDEWQDVSRHDEQYIDAFEYRELPNRESSAERQPANNGSSVSEFALSLENLRSSYGPSQVLLSRGYANETVGAAGMAMHPNYAIQHRAMDNLHTGYADAQVVSPSLRGSPSIAPLMSHPIVADNEAEPSRQFASYTPDQGAANTAQRYRDSAEEAESLSGLSIVSFESEALTLSSIPRQHPSAHFPYHNQWAATSDPALSPTESMKSSKSDDTNEANASVETTTPMLRRSAPSLSGGPAPYSQMYDNYRAGTLISGARPYNPDLPAFKYADFETDDDSSESSSSSENETDSEAIQIHSFGSDSLRATPKSRSPTHPDERYGVEDEVRQPNEMPQILDMPIPDWSVINALANQPPREGMDSFARSWMQNTSAVMAYQAGTPLSPISEKEEPVEENCPNCFYCIKYPYKKCPQKCRLTLSRSASISQVNDRSSASRPSPVRNSFHHSFSRIARLEASPYARTEPIFGSVPITNNRHHGIKAGPMVIIGSRIFSTGISRAPLQRRSTLGSLRRRRGSQGNHPSLRTTFMQGHTPPILGAHDEEYDAYDEDFFLSDDDGNWQIYPDNSDLAPAAPLPALDSYQPLSNVDRERMVNSLQAGMGMLAPDDARRGACKMELRQPESAYMPGCPNTPQGTRVASLECFSGSIRSSDSPRSPIVGESLGDYVSNWNQTAMKKSKGSKLSNPSSDGLEENSPLAKKGKEADKGKGAGKPLPASPHPVRTSSLQGKCDKHMKSAEEVVTPERASSLGATRNDGLKSAEKKVSPDKGKSVLSRSAAGMELSPEQETAALGAPYNIFGDATIQPEIILTPPRREFPPAPGCTSDNRSPAQRGNSMSPNRVVNLDTNTICKNIADTLSDYSGSYCSLQSPPSMRSNQTPHKLKPKKSTPHSRQGLGVESFTPTEDKKMDEPRKLPLKESSSLTKDKSSDKSKRLKLNKPLPVPRLSPNASDSNNGTSSPSRSTLSFTRIKEKAKTLFMSDKDSRSDKGKEAFDSSPSPFPVNDTESAGEGVLPSPGRAGDSADNKENDQTDTPCKLDRFRKAAKGLGGRRKNFGEKMINAD